MCIVFTHLGSVRLSTIYFSPLCNYSYCYGHLFCMTSFLFSLSLSLSLFSFSVSVPRPSLSLRLSLSISIPPVFSLVSSSSLSTPLFNIDAGIYGTTGTRVLGRALWCRDCMKRSTLLTKMYKHLDSEKREKK